MAAGEKQEEGHRESDELTSGLLRVFYLHRAPLSSLVPRSTLLDTDSNAFRTFLNTTIVASQSQIILGQAYEDSAARMKEVIDRVHEKLFSAHLQLKHKVVLGPGEWWSSTPPNILCKGYRPADSRSDTFIHLRGGLSITNHFANTMVTHLRKSPEWHTLVTRVGEGPLITLFTSPLSAVFAPLPNKCYLQLSGQPINTANSVMFVRTRLYHARPSKTSRGQVTYGFSPKNILSRLPTLFPSLPLTPPPPPSDLQKRHLLKYIFPRQFTLDNPFTTPKPNWKGIADYTDREDEIAKLGPIKTPKRLKPALDLVEKLIKLQAKCNYRKLLDRFCPRKVLRKGTTPPAASSATHSLPTPDEPRTQISRGEISIDVSQRSLIYPHGGKQARAKARAKPKFSEYECTPYEVDSFVRAVIRDVVPRDFWGSEANTNVILNHVSTFVRLRRHETFSVHALVQDFCISDCDWLRAPSSGRVQNRLQKPNAADMVLRGELLAEFMFWFVDGFLFDLLRTTFMMTESAKSRNRTLFFRQDDWDAVCRPLLATIQKTMFDEVPKKDAERILRNRTLTYSYLRLLPKDTGGVRPIVNLQRKPWKLNLRGEPERHKSINQHLQSTFYALCYERGKDPSILGAAVQGETQIHQRIKAFKESLQVPGQKLPKLYFVKVDVKACFDTIKQDKVLEIIESVLKQKSYVVQKYSQVTCPSGRVSKKWPRQAHPGGENWSFSSVAAVLTDAIRHAVFSDGVLYPTDAKSVMLALVREHVKCNLVKIGGRYFRQRDGIPQGSILSSFLCNLFYAHMEKAVLRFTRDQSSLLMRYIDDFLFISTKRIPEYGCSIAPDKRLTNFAITLDPGEIVPTHASAKNISDTLTVQRIKYPGKAFLHKMLETCKARAHLLYNDTTHNSLLTVYLNIYQSFLLSALKFHAIVEFMFVAIKNRSRKGAGKDGIFMIKRGWVTW
ncbi:hypothetical protein RQP46_006823 [Phenoliferia psychrophenolica]